MTIPASMTVCGTGTPPLFTGLCRIARRLSACFILSIGLGLASPLELRAETLAQPPHHAGHVLQGQLTRAEWDAFEAAFVLPDGRVIDRENAEQSHSEGQGYGMLLAVEAGNIEAFDRIWSFAQRELQVRPADSLLSWRWQAQTNPHVADPNNASDGDVLVAYALLRAAVLWERHDYLDAADGIVDDIGRSLIRTLDGAPVLMPAAFGFDGTSGNQGPVLNLSYYIYPAFELFALVRPEYPWLETRREGLRLTVAAGTGALGLVPDWVSPREGRLAPARGFNARSSYEAVRIPLYMALGGEAPEHLIPFDRAWNGVGIGHPVDYNLRDDRATAIMRDPGYRIIAAIAACASRGVPIPPALTRFRPTTYFASNLHLLGLVAARRHYGECLEPPAMAVSSTVHIASSTMPAVPAMMETVQTPLPAPRRHSILVQELRGDRVAFSGPMMRHRWLPER